MLVLTWAVPEQILALAYDAGGVTTNVVTVPLIVAIGLGLAGSARERNTLRDGFGLVALCVMVPIIGVQLYGIWVYSFGETGATAQTQDPEEESVPWLLEHVLGLAETVRDVLPLVLVILFFQYIVLRRRLDHPARVAFGLVMVLVGLYAFVVGLELGLFPLGNVLAEQLIARGAPVLIVLFALLIGFATTMAEPALVAIGEQARDVSSGRISASGIRAVVAVGVAVGIASGAYRILVGAPFQYFIMAAYAIALVLVLLAPRYIIALAFDLAGATTSAVTVPLVTALGTGLATGTEGRDPLIDGFGLIAFASVFSIIAVLVYATALERFPRLRRKRS